MAVFSKIEPHSDAVDYFKEVPFYNKPIENQKLKGLINIKSKNQKKFFWCHFRYINPSKKHPKRILKTDKKISEKRNYDEIEFPVQEKEFNKIEVKTIYALTCLVTQMGWFFQFMFQIKNLKTRGICCF